MEPFDIVSGGAPPSPGTGTKEAISPGGGGSGLDETEGRGSGRSPGTVATTEYEATRRLM